MSRALRCCLVVLFSTVVAAQDLASFEKRISVKTLANGLTIIVCERHEAPVFSFYTLVDAGAAQDPKGETGMAHMFEHMAFKGTTTIGTTDYAAEKVALEKEEQAYLAFQRERLRRVGQDRKKLEELENWDSTSLITFIALAGANPGVSISPAQIVNCSTVADLLRLARAEGSPS